MADHAADRHGPLPTPGWVEDDLVAAVLTASRALVAVSARSLGVVDESLTLLQFRTLVVLRTHGGMSQSRMAEQLAVPAPTVARLVERLVERGMAARCPQGPDHREAGITLTEQGTRTVAEVTDRRRAEIARIVAAMPSDDRAGLVVALRAFAHASGEVEAAFGPADSFGW